MAVVCLQPRCQRRPCYTELSCLEDTRVPCLAYSEGKEECLERGLCDTVGMCDTVRICDMVGMWPSWGGTNQSLGSHQCRRSWIVLPSQVWSITEHLWYPATKCVSRPRVCFCDTWSLLWYGLNGSYLVLYSLCGHHSLLEEWQ